MGTAGWRGMVGAMKRSPTVIVKEERRGEERREEKRRGERNRHC
jgi:hypothetical protein